MRGAWIVLGCLVAACTSAADGPGGPALDAAGSDVGADSSPAADAAGEADSPGAPDAGGADASGDSAPADGQPSDLGEDAGAADAGTPDVGAADADAADAPVLPDVPDPCDEELYDPTCCCGSGEWRTPSCGPTGWACPEGLTWAEGAGCMKAECGWVEGTDTVDGETVPDATGDATADATPADAAPTDTASCTWLTDPTFFTCGGQIMVASVTHALGNPGCPATWKLGGTTYDDFASLVAATGCDDCEYHATKAVDFLSCLGGKTGYEVYEAPGCPDLYGTPGGPYLDLCHWPAQSCYCN